MSYDTLRHYIESCAKDDNSWEAFEALTIDVKTFSSDTNRYHVYRDWLISVLYLNTTQPLYFCSCLYAMASTYRYTEPYGKYAALGIVDYLRKNQGCNSLEFQYIYDQMINDRHQEWLDKYHKGDTTTEDTTVPTLDQLGLGIVLQHNGISPEKAILPIYLASFTSNPNPFVKETTLEFDLNRMAYTTIAIYDELGRLVWGDGRGSSLEAGKHTIHLDGSTLPHGVLYARISTGFGEVKTVKLVHE